MKDANAIASFCREAAEKKLYFHSICIAHNERDCACIRFAPYDEKTEHSLFSLSKSFTSAAAGFAVAEGLLAWDSRVCDVLHDVLPEKVPEKTKTITLSHLLMMGSGLDPATDAWEIPAPWARSILAHDCVTEPGSTFRYNTHGTYLVSAMVQKVCGMSIRDYLVPRLFRPLGIAAPDWDTDPDGICVGGTGLHLPCEAIVRFGICILQGGVWNGVQVLPKEWIERAAKKKIETRGHYGIPTEDWQVGYGYQIWMMPDGDFRGDGAYGQYCIVSPKRHRVIAVMAGLVDMAEEMDLLRRYFLQEELPLEPCQTVTTASPDIIPDNEENGSPFDGVYKGEGHTLVLQEDTDGVIATLDERLTCRFGYKQDRYFSIDGDHDFVPDIRLQGRCRWHEGALEASAIQTTGPVRICFRLHFEDNGVRSEAESVGMPPLKGITLKKA